MDCLTVSCYIWNEGCKIDGPAWVQAVGSVLAILAAAGIAWWQNRQTRIASEKSDKAKSLGQIQVANLFAGKINELFDDAYKNAKHQNGDNSQMIAMKLEDVLSWSKTFATDGLDHEQMSSFINIRYATYELLQITKYYSTVHDTAGDIKQIYKKISRQVFWHGVNLPDWMDV